MLEVAATSVNLPRQFIASGVTSSRLLSYLLLDARWRRMLVDFWEAYVADAELK